MHQLIDNVSVTSANGKGESNDEFPLQNNVGQIDWKTSPFAGNCNREVVRSQVFRFNDECDMSSKAVKQ